MMHRGIEYSVAQSEVPDVWKWQFRIGEIVKSGKTETRINLLAVRRVQLQIDRELKKATRASTPSFTASHGGSLSDGVDALAAAGPRRDR